MEELKKWTDKPILLVVRTSIPNDLFLHELRKRHRVDSLSEVVRKIFYNMEDLDRNGIDLFEISNIEKVKKLFNEKK